MSEAYTLAEKASLAGRNGFRVAARAELLIDVRRPEALGELFGFKLLQQQPVLVLGEGSNILFAGDVRGVVLSVAATGIRVLDDDGDTVLLRAEAGERWDDLVRHSLARGLCGLENLSLIPGTVGASPIQNIGAYGTEVGEFVETVEAWDRDGGELVRLSRAGCGFAYRDSVFKRQPARYVVTAVELRLPRQRELRMDYPGVREELAAMGIEQPRAPHLAEAICRIRARKLPNPALIGNVGSFFKNPIVPADLDVPGAPAFPGPDPATKKLSAAWLIEQCGWKGSREGDAGVSAQHALVLVNHGHATGAQLLDLARRIAASVAERFGVALEPEARIVGASWS